MIYLRVKNIDNEVLVDSFPTDFHSPQQESEKKGRARYYRKKVPAGIYEILLEKEERIANSNAVFNAFVASVENILEGFTSRTTTRAREMADDYLHNIIKIHGNQKSIIERCVLKAEGLPTYNDFVTSVKNELLAKPNDFAEDICALSKEVRLVDYHIGGYKLLSDASSRVAITDNHNLKKFLLGLSHLFFDSFNKNFVFLSLHDINENFRCSIEYETFNIAIHSFLENAVKYSKPYSRINVYTKDESGELVFEMESVRIEKTETRSILERGVYGKNVPEDLRGSGIGMYQLKKALDRSSIIFSIFPDHSEYWEVNDVTYTRNTFIFKFPKYSL